MSAIKNIGIAILFFVILLITIPLVFLAIPIPYWIISYIFEPRGEEAIEFVMFLSFITWFLAIIGSIIGTIAYNEKWN
jgi:O-antigen/teichoic acid export membrane protein